MSLIIKTMLIAIGMLCFDLLLIGVAGGKGVVSIAFAMFLVVVSMAVAVGFILKFLLFPIQKLYDAVKVIDFDNDMIDFSRVDELEPAGSKEIHFLQERFKYLIERLSDRIDRVNNVTYESEHDKLTNCYNRERLEKYKSSYEEARSCCVIFIDVNNLKKMNDIFGHEAGDTLLENAADRIRFWSNYGDVYRIGGDEFLIVIVNKSENCIMELFNKWYPTVGVLNRASDGFKCVLSYGISFASEQIDFEALKEVADNKMYTFKENIKREFGEQPR